MVREKRTAGEEKLEVRKGWSGRRVGMKKGLERKEKEVRRGRRAGGKG